MHMRTTLIIDDAATCLRTSARAKSLDACKPFYSSAIRNFIAVERGKRVNEMPRNIYVVVCVLVLIAVVVGVDLLFFKNRLWERLMVNIGLVLVFAAFYLRFLKNQ